MTKIRCVVERITYQNPDNGYSVLKVRLNGYDDLITVVGNLLDVTAGSVLSIEGDWKVDAKYGRQFIAEQWEETIPATLYGIEKYLGSGLIKGVGPKCAKKIVSAFGLETISIIEGSPKKLLSVPGIGRRRIEKITESWERQKEVKNIRCTPQHYIPTIIIASFRIRDKKGGAGKACRARRRTQAGCRPSRTTTQPCALCTSELLPGILMIAIRS